MPHTYACTVIYLTSLLLMEIKDVSNLWYCKQCHNESLWVCHFACVQIHGIFNILATSSLLTKRVKVSNYCYCIFVYFLLCLCIFCLLNVHDLLFDAYLYLLSSWKIIPLLLKVFLLVLFNDFYLNLHCLFLLFFLE